MCINHEAAWTASPRAAVRSGIVPGYFLWSCHSWDRLTSPTDQNSGIPIRVPEVSFLIRSGLTPFPEILNKVFFKAFLLCRVSLKITFLGDYWYFGCQLHLYVGCSLDEARCALQLYSCFCICLCGTVPQPHQTLFMGVQPYIAMLQCWWQLQMLVHVMTLERCHTVALGTQTTAAVDQSSLVCMDSAETWGVKATYLLSCSNGVGCTRTAELLHRKGYSCPCLATQQWLVSEMEQSQRPAQCLCVLLSRQSVANRSQPSHTRERGQTMVTHSKLLYLWCR